MELKNILATEKLAENLANNNTVEYNIEKIVQQIKDGEISPSDVYIKVKEFTKILDKLKKEIQEHAEEEASTNGDDRFSFVTTTKYKYEEDKEYQRLKLQLKHREQVLKDATEHFEKYGEDYVDQDGVIVTSVPKAYNQTFKYTPKR